MNKIKNAEKVMERNTFGVLQLKGSSEFLLADSLNNEYYLGDRKSTALPDKAFYEAIEVPSLKAFIKVFDLDVKKNQI